MEYIISQTGGISEELKQGEIEPYESWFKYEEKRIFLRNNGNMPPERIQEILDMKRISAVRRCLQRKKKQEETRRNKKKYINIMMSIESIHQIMKYHFKRSNVNIKTRK